MLPLSSKKTIQGRGTVLRLFRLKVLPPLSPEGCQFAMGAREGRYTCADVAGEGLFQFLQDGLPGYEVFFGKDRANELRGNIEKLRRGDPEEIRTLLSFGFKFEPADEWSIDEKSRVSRYPTAIETSGVLEVRPIVQHDSARDGSECNSPRKGNKMTNCSPKSLWTREQMGDPSDSRSEPPTSVATLDSSNYEGEMERSSGGKILPKDNSATAEQLDSEDQPQSPIERSTASSKSSDCESEDDDVEPEDKLLYEMFPYARFRQM